VIKNTIYTQMRNMKYNRKFISNIIIEFLNENNQHDKYIYHGTGKGQALNIQKDGYMKPNRTGEAYPSISFTNDLNYANYYANAKGGNTNMVVLRTKLDDEFMLSPRIKNNKGDEYITFDAIPSTKLEILTKNSGWQSLNDWNVIFDEPKGF